MVALVEVVATNSRIAKCQNSEVVALPKRCAEVIYYALHLLEIGVVCKLSVELPRIIIYVARKSFFNLIGIHREISMLGNKCIHRLRSSYYCGVSDVGLLVLRRCWLIALLIVAATAYKECSNGKCKKHNLFHSIKVLVC